MNFNSVVFLLFLGIVLLLYWIMPHRFRWILLLVASYYFYMSWNPWLVFLILGTTLVSYGAALAISKTEKRRWKKFWLVLTLVVCLGVLVMFKYLDFLIESVVDVLRLFSLQLDGFALGLLLPVGISFYTFQTLSYVIDVYRGTIAPEKHLGYYALFVSFFPQLVAGPIERAGNLLPQLRAEHTFDSDDMAAGFRIMLVGFFRKCAIADVCGIYVTNVFGNLAAANSLSVALAGILFIIQIYCDFAGYSEIAMGIARMMGIRLMKNFDRPFLALSWSEWFRRWHISLTRWFIDYVYIPLGGNRKGKARKVLNIFIVFILCGLWHGANWTYAIWGVYVAVMQSLETLLFKPLGKLFAKMKIDGKSEFVRLLRRIPFAFTIAVGGLIFRAASVEQLGEVFRILFTGFGNYFDGAVISLGFTSMTILQFALALTCMCMLWHFEEYRPKEAPQLLGNAERTVYAQKVSVYFYLILAIAVFWLSLLASENASAFLYFQF